MKPYYEVFVKNSGFITIATTKELAKQERVNLQREGHKAVYVRLKKGPSRISDYHQGGY